MTINWRNIFYFIYFIILFIFRFFKTKHFAWTINSFSARSSRSTAYLIWHHVPQRSVTYSLVCSDCAACACVRACVRVRVRACGALLLQNRVYAWTFFQHHATGQSQSDHHTKPVTCTAVSREGKIAVTGTYVIRPANVYSADTTT